MKPRHHQPGLEGGRTYPRRGAAMRPGAAPRAVAATLIGKVIDELRSLDALTESGQDCPGWAELDGRDRSLARAIAVTALRHRGRIERALGSVLDRPPPARARHLLHTLHCAAAQILFLDVPDSAAVDLAVEAISGDPRTARFAAMTNAVLRRLSREGERLLASAPSDAATVFPGWLREALRRDHGRQRCDTIARMVSLEPVLDLTLDPRLAAERRDALTQSLQQLGARQLPTGSWRLADQGPVTELPGFAEGEWWVQDVASAIPARLLGAVAGKRVADLCAAPGGKTAQLAAAGARVTAVDISPSRLARLRSNLDRLGLEAETIAADILEWEPGVRFEAVLLDAPCSSTGTLRRHPDVAWTRTARDVESLAMLQRRLVERALGLLEPGGVLVYSNCSLLKQEGEDLVADLLTRQPGLRLLPVLPDEMPGLEGLINGQGALRTLPVHLPSEPERLGGMDGFFACRLAVAL